MTDIGQMLPPDFEADTRRWLGDERYQVYLEALRQPAPASIRLNPSKTDARPEHAERVPWCEEGFYLEGRPEFTFDPLLHAGCYYVQEAASMFVAHVLRHLVSTPVVMLDLCAAPGGKTTATRATLPAGSVLLANEPVKVRASILSENVQKQGFPDVIVTNNYPRDYRKSGLLFDVVLADVPCSGEGMFRKDPATISEWSTENVAKCQQLQRSIVSDIWPAIRPGGYLIYSTCTFNIHEDEENVEWMIRELGAQPITIPIEKNWGITGSLLPSSGDAPLPVYRFIPGISRSEGLFMAVLRKPAKGDEDIRKDRSANNKRHARGSAKPNQQALPLQWLGDGSATGAAQWIPVVKKDKCFAIPLSCLDAYQKADASLHVIHAGVTLGTMKGRDLIPAASLALSLALYRQAFPQVEVSWQEAIRFLRKEALTLPDGTPKGFVIISYQHHPLGFCKNIGNRANNLYPQEWKIKSGHVPENQPGIL